MERTRRQQWLLLLFIGWLGFLFLAGCGQKTPVTLAPDRDSVQLEVPSGPVTRLIAMGDTGEGSPQQYAVAAGAQARCDQAGGCDGFLMLGDNIYDVGPSSGWDPQFDEKIDQPYAQLKQGPAPEQGPDLRPRLPIYATLGNHDLGATALNFGKIAYYKRYAERKPWFYFPDPYYDIELKTVHLVSIHTNPLAYLGAQYYQQGRLVEKVVNSASAAAPWIVVIGHHPYRSNGTHGNAGMYEGVPGDTRILGGEFRKWIDEYVCNKVDFYLSGHDHNRQWLASVPNIPSWPKWLPDDQRKPCLTHFAVSGAGAKSRAVEDRENDLSFGSDQLGFLFLEFTPSEAHVEFCDVNGNTEWVKSFTKPSMSKHDQSLLTT